MFFNENCVEFHVLLSTNENVLKQFHSSEKYNEISDTREK